MVSQNEIWLRGNRRALVVGSILPAVLGTVGFLAAANWLPLQLSIPLRLAAGILTLLSLLVVAAMANQARFPRLAYNNRELFVYAGPARPYRIPIDVVEVFFGGQGVTDLQIPGHKIEAKHIVVRLAERHKEWHERKMRASFGRWSDGYISINGAWCEPINAELIQRMNHTLVEIKRELRKSDGADGDTVPTIASRSKTPGGCGMVEGCTAKDPTE